LQGRVLPSRDSAKHWVIVAEFYRFEATRGADGQFDPAVELLVAAEIYDALTAPKI